MVDVLEEHGVIFDEGLTQGELQAIELRFSFRFPPDLSTFLQCGLPQGEFFPDWRNLPEEQLREMLELPYKDVLFDVENNGFWLPEWGEQPTTLTNVKSKLRGLLNNAPTLIPVRGTHMMPDRPHLKNNPVFSIRQTDIVYYGSNLRDWLLRSFLCDNTSPWPHAEDLRVDIEFWNPSRFATRWFNGPITFDNSKGYLP